MPELDVDLWLTAEDIEPEAEITIADVGEQKELPVGEGEEPKKVFEIGIVLANGEKRKWTMNKTSQRAIAKSYSTKTENWVDKKVTVFVSEQNVSGTMKKVIYARIPEGIPEEKVE